MGLAISYLLLGVKRIGFNAFFNAKGKFPLLYINIALAFKMRPNRKKHGAFQYSCFFNSPDLAPISPCKPFCRPRVYLHLIFHQMDDFLTISCVIYLPKSFPFLLKNDCPNFLKVDKIIPQLFRLLLFFTPPLSITSKASLAFNKTKIRF